jgi:DNA-binding IclR family transcriptional regulator
MRKLEPLQGTQSAAKALALLRHVGACHPDGIRLTDLMALSGQNRSTAHRLLACLLEQDYVERAAPGKTYRLGLASLEMGLVSADMAPVVERFRPLMQRAARQSGDTVFLMVRSGDHSLCLHREEGSYPVKAFMTEPGTRTLMGISLTGVAMLAHLGDAEVAASYARHEEEYLRTGVPLFKLSNALVETRACGFSQMTDHRREVTRGVGGAIRFSRNSLVGISIAAINSRMSKSRRLQLGEFLVAELREFAWKPGAGS